MFEQRDGGPMRNVFEMKTNSTDRSLAKKRSELFDAGLTGMDAEQADWEEGLDEDDE